MSVAQTQSDNNSSTAAAKPQKNYGEVVLTLYNCLLPEAVFKETPSQANGLDIETETDLRIFGCELIQTAGILLKLPQVAMATGQTYLQRFYYSKSFVRYPVEAIAMGSIYLASKVEEQPRSIGDVMNVFHHMKQVSGQKLISPLIVNQYYNELKNEVIMAERRILKELGFCFRVKHPYKLVLAYLQLLQQENNHRLMQMAWNYINDALRTDVYMRYTPETIACACIYLSARKISLPLPNNPHWFLLFKVPEKDIREICVRILQLYKRPKVNSSELMKKLDALRRINQANKHSQAQKDREANTEEKKVEPPTASTPKATKTETEKDDSPKTPPLPNKCNSNLKAKRERRSRSPHDKKREYSSKRHESRSRGRELERSRKRRSDDECSRGSRSRKYEDCHRSKYDDNHRSKYEDYHRSKYDDSQRSKSRRDSRDKQRYYDNHHSKYDDSQRSKSRRDSRDKQRYYDNHHSKYEDYHRSKYDKYHRSKYEDCHRSKYEDCHRSKYEDCHRSKYDDYHRSKYDDYHRSKSGRDSRDERLR